MSDKTSRIIDGLFLEVSSLYEEGEKGEFLPDKDSTSSDNLFLIAPDVREVNATSSAKSSIVLETETSSRLVSNFSDPLQIIGKQVKHYFVLARLRCDFNYADYKVMDTRINKIMVLRFIFSFVDHEHRNSLKTKMERISRVSNVNIGAIYKIEEDVELIDECQIDWFIVMPFYQGKTLETIMFSRRSGFKDCYNIVFQVCLGLESAHKEGFIHGNINPANIMILVDGCVKLVNFSGDNSKVNYRMESTHSLQYRSPEQLKGESVSEATDVWSFGVILFELVSGSCPFEESTHEALIPLILSGLPRISHLDTDLRLKGIINRCLNKNPARRYQSVEELRHALKNYKRQRTRTNKSKIPGFIQSLFLSRRKILLVVVLCLILSIPAWYTLASIF